MGIVLGYFWMKMKYRMKNMGMTKNNKADARASAFDIIPIKKLTCPKPCAIMNTVTNYTTEF